MFDHFVGLVLKEVTLICWFLWFLTVKSFMKFESLKPRKFFPNETAGNCYLKRLYQGNFNWSQTCVRRPLWWP